MKGQKKNDKLSRLFTSACILLCGCFLLSAQDKDSTDIKSDQPRKITVMPVPSLGYSPETKTYLGAVALLTLNLYQDSLTRTSNTSLEFTYTMRRQMVLEADWNYFFKEEKWFTSGLLHISKYPDYYYGVGYDTEDWEGLLYESNRIIIDVNIYKNLGRKFFTGIGLRYLSYQNLSYNSENTFPELVNTSVFGIQGAILKDSRNNLLNSMHGGYYLLQTDYNFSTSNYLRLMLDLRKYLTINETYTFALRLYNSFNFNTPGFFDYSIMGGDRFVRGYFYGRYRDKNLSTFQSEFRMPLFWRFGFAVMGGLSSLYPDAQSFTNKIWPNYGAGLRFLIDRKNNVNLRIDYVRGANGQDGFYISFGESF